MAGLKNAWTVFLDQFQGQAYRSIYIDRVSLADFTGFMDGVFDGIQSITYLRVQVRYETLTQKTTPADLTLRLAHHNGTPGSAYGTRNGTSKTEDRLQRSVASWRAIISGSAKIPTVASHTSLSC